MKRNAALVMARAQADRDAALALIREAIAEAEPQTARDNLMVMLEELRIWQARNDPAFEELLSGVCERVDLPIRLGRKYMDNPELIGLLEDLRAEKGVRFVKDVIELYLILQKNHGVVQRKYMNRLSNVRGRDMDEALEWMQVKGIIISSHVTQTRSNVGSKSAEWFSLVGGKVDARKEGPNFLTYPQRNAETIFLPT